MREHPIPQDIVGYRFHIIGSMTLRQFAELAIGAILGLVIHATNLPDAIKWPLIFIAVTIGAAAAFLPIEERPLDHWIVTFFKTLNQPTKFFWEKSSKIPELFLFKAGQQTSEAQDEVDLTPARRQRIKDYLVSVRSNKHRLDAEDLVIQARIQSIMRSFDEISLSETSATKQANKPNLKTRTRSLAGLSIFENKAIAYDQAESEKKTLLATAQVAKTISVPETASTEVEARQALEETNDETTHAQQAVYVENIQTDKTNSTENSSEQAVTFNAGLPFPSKPTQPNKLVGMILTNSNELIPEAIIEIKDDQSRVVRAVKSNALGQFFISTPLKNGNYSIFISHDSYQFHPQEIVLESEVIDPIEIRSLS